MPRIARPAALATGLLLAIGFLMPTTAGASESATVVTVDSRTGWVAVPVQPGEGYLINASGTWTVDHRSIQHIGPEGYPNRIDRTIYQGCKLVESARYGLLLAKKGHRGETIRIGTSGHIVADGTGVVFFRINDADRCLGDNEGALSVRLS